ncbi:MAG: hypothetical protein EPO21_09415 [Chloroflexota bacterium]|nr:MAG: hypothetical protein EPO21_09415 [Chloroflexota bacterium]
MAGELPSGVPIDDGNGPPLELLIGRVRQQLPDQPEPMQIVDAYQLELDRLVDRMALLFGPLGVRAVIGRAMQIAVRKSPRLQGIQLLSERLDLGPVREQATQLEADSMEHLMTDFADAVLNVLCTLIGPDLVAPLLETVFLQTQDSKRED